MARMSRRKAARPPQRPPRSAADAAGPCPCGAGDAYGACCGRLHRGEAAAPTAERLMRSRYAAFATGDAAYLLATWHPDTRPARLDLDPRTRWTGLDVLSTTDGGVFHQDGTVAFRAHYREGGRDGVLAEHSTFTRVDGLWVYVAAVG
ncbi:hypothetical protein LO772_26460 [Yinghuangia sp. ASG 101]|uniref:YchJ family protein n=1 Tax=Yinghuangia sp. ASG 101 TaxID=2896848 RepID=UPI001E35F294|nr:YchJ family metal-binding protein [Yinghuangia sp. ASG 101]UGQ10377.1 hypothetical protein LO772_26460 [Yinghuangia sp. ASG 101]